jgi:hypothetical protein
MNELRRGSRETITIMMVWTVEAFILKLASGLYLSKAEGLWDFDLWLL